MDLLAAIPVMLAHWVYYLFFLGFLSLFVLLYLFHSLFLLHFLNVGLLLQLSLFVEKWASKFSSLSLWIAPVIHMWMPLQFSFVDILNSSPCLTCLFAMNRLIFSNFLIYQLFWNTASASFNALPLLMAGLSLPFPSFLFVPTSSLFPFHDTPSFPTTSSSSSFNPFFMSLVKGEGSSHDKGKEVVVDKPPTEAAKGEEAPCGEAGPEEPGQPTWIRPNIKPPSGDVRPTCIRGERGDNPEVYHNGPSL